MKEKKVKSTKRLWESQDGKVRVLIERERYISIFYHQVDAFGNGHWKEQDTNVTINPILIKLMQELTDITWADGTWDNGLMKIKKEEIVNESE